uniref:Uncharacterized protein n=1 Tax=Physcomitrium patens TaxID=3218 RepID=A0A2K1K8F8_PHYPA|nr:hypothetical protein PHYPA_011955 [Physcomitrium patens]
MLKTLISLSLLVPFFLSTSTILCLLVTILSPRIRVSYVVFRHTSTYSFHVLLVQNIDTVIRLANMVILACALLSSSLTVANTD